MIDTEKTIIAKPTSATVSNCVGNSGTVSVGEGIDGEFVCKVGDEVKPGLNCVISKSVIGFTDG